MHQGGCQLAKNLDGTGLGVRGGLWEAGQGQRVGGDSAVPGIRACRRHAVRGLVRYAQQGGRERQNSGELGIAGERERRGARAKTEAGIAGIVKARAFGLRENARGAAVVCQQDQRPDGAGIDDNRRGRG